MAQGTQAIGAEGLRLAVAGGGSGGHILPGIHLLAHAREGELAHVLWFQAGRAVEERALAGLAQRLAPAALERAALSLEPAGGGAPSTVSLLLRAAPAVPAARAALRRHRSEVLLGLGGFTSLPPVLAARSLGIPVALLEINAVAGRATRWLAPWARAVLHAWPSTCRRAPSGRHVWTGPPLAPEFLRGAPAEEEQRAARAALGVDPDLPLLVVLGGSQGSQALNRFVREHAAAFRERGVQVLHQTGPGRLAEAAAPAPSYRAVEYVDGVHRALRAATLVLCRGGASTLAEIGALRRPAWVVPYPHHRDRHQERNAEALGSGARIVREADLGADFARRLAHLAGTAGERARAEMSAALEGIVPLDAARRAFDVLARIARAPARH